MCTVTFIPLKNDQFILTSNRDVSYTRKKAESPKKYIENGVELLYPKDGKGGGTWIGASSKKRLLCLLNGGFIFHKSKTFYKASRGQIVLELLKCEHLINELKEINLIDIEPFTIIIVEWKQELKLMEFVWDGKNKHLKDLPQEAQIWSSSTLFTSEMKNSRTDWFKSWQNENIINKESILEFHHKAGIGDPNIDVILKRENVGTVSITLVSKDHDGLSMKYEAI